MYNTNEFGKRMKLLRENAGLTQEELADALHISTDYEGKLETGKRMASVELCISASIFFSVSLDYLLLGKKRPTEGLKKQVHNLIRELIKLEKQLP